MNWLLMTLLACSTKNPKQETNNTKVEPEVQEEVEQEQEQQFEQYGAEFTVEEIIPASDLLSNPEQYVDKNIRVSGKVGDVCQKMGCWMVITEGDKHMRITTKDHKFFVAKDGAGSECQIEGIVIKKEADKERSEHYASESSDDAPVPQGEIDNTATYEIVATGIRFLK
jgi:hypothetical protein